MSGLFFADLVREAVSGSGTGALVLAGAAPGHRSFASVVPDGASFHYSLSHADNGQWEVGTGSLDSEGRLERAPLASSAGGGAVDFADGAKTASLTVASAWYAARDAIAAHDHVIEQVEGLADALAAKQAAGDYAPQTHSHPNLSDAPGDGQVYARQSGSWAAVEASDPVTAMPDGSAAAPGWAFVSDADTGFFRPGANSLGIVTGGVERARWGSAGGIHIGGTSPLSSYPLRVTGQILVESATGGSAGSLTLQGGTGGGNPKTLNLQVLTDGRTFFDPPSGGTFEIRPGGLSAMLVAANNIRPGSDNVVSLGLSSRGPPGARHRTALSRRGPRLSDRPAAKPCRDGRRSDARGRIACRARCGGGGGLVAADRGK